jgi:hypothetical protein
MKKTSLLLVLGVALVLASAAAPKANAGVVVGVAVGAPGYVYPVHRYGYVAPAYVMPGPYAYVPAPVYPRVYGAPVYYQQWYPRHYVARRDYYRGDRRGFYRDRDDFYRDRR